MRQKPESKSKGTILAEVLRKEANALSIEERQTLLGKALELIYRE
jgi:hypothetical protein